MTEISIPRGAIVADLGCGTGNTTRWFARKIGQSGEVTGVDVSADQLAIARGNVEADDHANIQFVNANAYDTGLPRDYFDVVHCRLLLCHLIRPLDALREMVAIARPGGVIICFDIDITGLISFPATDCYARVQELITASGQHRGTDDTLGVKLPCLFLQVGLVEPEIAFIHPVFLRGQQKRLWEYTFLEASPHFVSSGLTNEAEVRRLSAELATVAADETVSVAQARMPVTWARKPR